MELVDRHLKNYTVRITHSLQRRLSGNKVRSQLTFSTTSAVFDVFAGDRLSASVRKAWLLKDAREWESTIAVVVRSSVLAMAVAGGGRWATTS